MSIETNFMYVRGYQSLSVAFSHQSLRKGEVVENPENDIEVHYGFSVCSEKDQFCRMTGRNIANGNRFLDTPLFSGTVFVNPIQLRACPILWEAQHALIRRAVLIDILQNNINSPIFGFDLLNEIGKRLDSIENRILDVMIR